MSKIGQEVGEIKGYNCCIKVCTLLYFCTYTLVVYFLKISSEHYLPSLVVPATFFGESTHADCPLSNHV